MRRSFPVIWFLCASCAVSAAGAAYLFVSAMATASLRFWYCGPTSLDHVEPSCRIGTRLLLTSYGVGSFSAVLAVIAIWLWRRQNRNSKHSSETTPLRGSM